MRYSNFTRLFRGIAFALLIALALPAASRADDGQGQDGQGQDGHGVPQFDMGTAGAAFTLLAGSFLVLKARRQRRKAG
jgi:hypothetical protein